MTLAKHWYEAESLATALTLMAGLITGFFGGWATLRAANPKRQLAYWMPTITPILHTSDSVGDLLVMRGGQALRDPHVLDVKLMNRGRRDVASSHFDRDLPILLDVGAPIVELLGITSRPASLHTATVVVEGTALKIAPGLIARGQTISFSLLVDGPTPRVSCQASLIDVTVQERRDSTGPQRLVSVSSLATGLGISLLGLVLLSFLQATDGRRVPFTYGQGIVLLILIAAIAAWKAARSWARRRQSPLNPPGRN